MLTKIKSDSMMSVSKTLVGDQSPPRLARYTELHLTWS